MTGPVSEAERVRQTFLERYKADRAQELELNKFSGELEKTFLQAAAILNGGSATIFLSFIGSTLDKTKVNPRLVSVAFGLWLAGLIGAIIAGFVAYRAQDYFARATRNRRDGTGIAILDGSYRQAMGVSRDDTPATLLCRAARQQEQAEWRWKLATGTGVASVVLFCLGAGFALATVLTAAHVLHSP